MKNLILLFAVFFLASCNNHYYQEKNNKDDAYHDPDDVSTKTQNSKKPENTEAEDSIFTLKRVYRTSQEPVYNVSYSYSDTFMQNGKPTVYAYAWHQYTFYANFETDSGKTYPGMIDIAGRDSVYVFGRCIEKYNEIYRYADQFAWANRNPGYSCIKVKNGEVVEVQRKEVVDYDTEFHLLRPATYVPIYAVTERTLLEKILLQ
jgi:hypothetical protein